MTKINQGGRANAGPFGVEFIPVSHSIPEACALAIHTSAGTLIHTGDWKLDDDPVIGTPTDVKRLQELGDEGVLAVIADSTNAMNPGHSPSEGATYEGLLETVAEQEGRVVVTCFASNVACCDACTRGRSDRPDVVHGGPQFTPHDRNCR